CRRGGRGGRLVACDVGLRRGGVDRTVVEPADVDRRRPGAVTGNVWRRVGRVGAVGQRDGDRAAGLGRRTAHRHVGGVAAERVGVTVDCARSSCWLNVADSVGVDCTVEPSAGVDATRTSGDVVSLMTVAAGDVPLVLPAGSVSVATPLSVPSARLEASTGSL